MKILKDWPKKVLALLIATGIWLYVFQTGNTKRVYPVSVEVKNEPLHLISKAPYRTAVKVEVEGEKSLFNSFNPQNIQAILDLGKAKKGKNKYLVRLNQLFISSGLTVKILDPYIQIQFEEIVSKKVKVIAKTEGLVAGGFSRHEVVIDPEEITIRGPESIVQKIHRVYTGSIDVSGKKASFETKIKLDKPDQQVAFAGSQSVNVKIVIGAELRGRTFTSVPIKVFGLSPRLKIISGNLILEKVTLKGPVSILAKLTKDKLTPFIVITNPVVNTEIEVKVRLVPLTGLSVELYEPKILKIKLGEGR
jgi:YbbR domain-containing protein